MRRTVQAICAALLFAVWLPSAAQAWESRVSVQWPRPLKVMTQNLYIGTDLFQLFQPAPPEQLPFIVAGMYGQVLATDFPSRARAIAAEAARFQPDLIALQEVTLVRWQHPGDTLAGNPIPATEVALDYLQEVLDALESLGLHYEVAAAQDDFDVELPIIWPNEATGAPSLDDIRVTDRDVVLRRQGIQTANVTMRHFLANVEFPFGGLLISFARGFIALDATVRHRTYRIINTHLESVDPGPRQPYQLMAQAGQAYELLAEVQDETRPVVLVGDLNSEPDDPFGQAYAILAGGGFVDTWLRRLGGADPGYSCCQDADLLNAESVLSMRIDHVLVRNWFDGWPFPLVGPVLARTVGDEPDDRTPSGLWPSDHAGLQTELFLPIVTAAE
ncbi:MAG TPA: endonuclease/exonuclease/phosphatase family protein [bacterium]|nr:endonuclease/exonuclease/phosphatase family protein [bacterium]